jgi:hypothetical protein
VGLRGGVKRIDVIQERFCKTVSGIPRFKNYADGQGRISKRML